MTRKRKLLLLILGGFVALVLLVLLLLPFLIDVNVYRATIEGRAEDFLGREVSLGEMKLSFLPFGLRVDDIAIGSLPEEGPGDLLTAESLRVGARLLPLLKKRLEITSVEIREPAVLLARDAEGAWNVQRLIAADTGAAAPPVGEAATEVSAPAIAVDAIRLTGGRITLRDQAIHPGETFEVSLVDIDLTVTDLAIDKRVGIELSTGLDALPDGRLRFDGRVGPLAPAPGEPFRFEGELDLDDLDPDALGELLRSAGLLDTVPKGFFGGRRVSLSTGIDVSFDTEAGALAIDRLEADLDGSTFALKGRTAAEGEARRIDLSLLPSQIRADHIRSLLAIVYTDAPVRFESGSPLEVEAKVSGLLGPEQLPDVEGSASVRGYTFHHPSLATPMKDVGATLRIRRDAVEIDSLTAVIGSSDLTGDLTLSNFAAPRVTFDIRSKHADFFELFSFMSPPEESSGGGAAADPAAEDLMRTATVNGTVAIERGSFQKLEFTDLAATMRWTDGVLVMDPFRMDLYDGSFNGKLTYRPLADPPSFEIGGSAAQIDLAPLIADSVEVEGLIAGRFTGEVNASGAGADYESIVRGMKGGGSARIDNGVLGALDILGTLSNVTGIFGEQTLSSLSRQMATEGTEFTNATTNIKVAGGALRLDDLKISSPWLDLNGQGRVDLLGQDLDGALQIVFSREVSDSMKAENSRAGKVFWNSKSNRVEFPFELAGTMAEPSIGVDWGKAAETYVKREGRDKLNEILAEKLGVSLGGDAKAEDPQKMAPGSAPAPAAASRTGPGGLEATIDKVEWKGSFLMKDLRFQGKIRGERLDRATLVVTDAGGKQLLRVDRVGAVKNWLDKAADKTAMAEIGWRNEVDGKDVALGEAPFTITMTVYNTDGESAEVQRTVNK